jgi:hypothetical protein
MDPDFNMSGDIVAILAECPWPIVLRSHRGGEYYEVIGTCYCDGIVQDEAMRFIEFDHLVAEDFRIK